MRTLRLLFAASVTSACGVWIACSSSSTPPAGTTTPDSGGGDSAIGSVFTLGIPCTDSQASIYGDPGTLPADKGDIIKCFVDADISMSDLQTRLAANISNDGLPATNQGYTGKPVTSGAHVYRILYRTERGDTASSPGYSSAKVFIPIVPRAAGPMPLVVGARGSRGQAASCAASLEDPSAKWVNGDYEALAFPIVGLGLPIVVPDLAGYANFGAAGNPVSGYAQFEDVGKGTLDGARAMKKMFPNAFSGKIAILGHSQGGHSAFSALAIQSTYAPELEVAAVAAYSPLWISQASWGAILFESEAYPLATEPTDNAVSVWYHYTHGELLDGPGHGLDPFTPEAGAAITHFINNDCWSAGYDGADAASTYPDLQAIAKTASDLYTTSFANSVSTAAALGSPCANTDAGTPDPVCAKWIARYAADRPHLSNTPPMLIEYGTEDQTIPPGRMACVIDRLNQDKATYSFCLNQGVGHTGVVRLTASNVADWLSSKLLGEPAPAACALTNADLVDDAGTLIKCEVPPPN